MRKFLILVAAGALALLLGASEGTAQRWRRSCPPCPMVYYQPCPVVYYSPCPIVYYPCPVVYYSYPPAYPGVAPLMMQPAPVAAAQTRTFTSPKGKSYRALLSNERGDFEHERAEPLPKTITAPQDAEDIFRGKTRAAAKLSIATAQEQTYDSISALIATLQSDDDMKNHDPPITKDKDSDRVAEEKRNVTVRAFIYAFRKEADNDYHVILGDDPNSDNVQYLNSEVSGLPTGGPFKARLTQVRSDFKGHFPADVLEHAKEFYVTFPTPIPVRVTGSLFWDIEHPPPYTVGPTAHKPRTAWEIHPVTKIDFEP